MDLLVKTIASLALILCQCACSISGSSVDRRLELQSQPYFSSIDDAAIYVTGRVNPESILHDREFIGLIMFDPLAEDSDYPYTFTVAKGGSGRDKVTGYFLKPQRMKVVAFWHTHGGAHHSRRYFSDVDTRTVNRTGVPFYLADYTGTLRVYAPGDSKLTVFQARKLGLGPHKGYAKGRVVKSPTTGQPVAIATRMSDAAAL